jgi:hypothetical protein
MKLTATDDGATATSKNLTPQDAAYWRHRIKSLDCHVSVTIVPEYDGEVSPQLAVKASAMGGGLPSPAWWLALSEVDE